MIVDTSALVAILRREPEEGKFLAAMMTSDAVGISAVSYFEFGMVIDRLDDAASSAAVDRLIDQVEAEIIPVTAASARAARAAYLRFGKGNHPACLNFGDCFAYALAKETGERLLYKGQDFAQTDIETAV